MKVEAILRKDRKPEHLAAHLCRGSGADAERRGFMATYEAIFADAAKVHDRVVRRESGKEAFCERAIELAGGGEKQKKSIVGDRVFLGADRLEMRPSGDGSVEIRGWISAGLALRIAEIVREHDAGALSLEREEAVAEGSELREGIRRDLEKIHH